MEDKKYVLKKQLDNFQRGTLAVKLVFLRALVRDRSCSTFDGMLQTTPVMQICQTRNRVSSSLWCAHRKLLFSIVASIVSSIKQKCFAYFSMARLSYLLMLRDTQESHECKTLTDLTVCLCSCQLSLPSDVIVTKFPLRFLFRARLKPAAQYLSRQ